MPDPTAPSIRYLVRFPAGRPGYLDVEARIPADGIQSHLELFLPVWTPGSYLVREYARHVESVRAWDSEQNPLTVVKTRKNRWMVKLTNPSAEISFHYSLYCNELTVRTNYTDELMALLNGAATFITVVESNARHTYQVTLELPPGWVGSWSGLDGNVNTFSAPDYDTLVDSPILAGSPSTFSFTIQGKPHIVLNFGDSAYWDIAKAAEDLRKIVLQYGALWGELPYERYLFFNLLTGGRGALEHGNSMVVMAHRFSMRTRSTYTAWLDLLSHEFCHVWNVKRLRPVELGPFDYENEVYTRNLWIAEGFTEYYGPLTVRRAGITTDEEFLGTNRAPEEHGGPETLSGWVEDLQNRPGRLQQSVSAASFDAWIKLYRPDENTPNSSISYYTKGAVVAWLLDAKVRTATGGARSLDHVMRRAFEKYSGSRGFTTDEFRQIAQQVAGIELNDWFNQVADTTEELDYSEALAWFGLRFKPARTPDTLPKAWLGFTTRMEAGRLLVARVIRDTPAYAAGIKPDDEILGIDKYRVLPDQWNLTMQQFSPDEVASLWIARRGRIIASPVRFGQPPRSWVLEVDPQATITQRRNLTAWLATL